MAPPAPTSLCNSHIRSSHAEKEQRLGGPPLISCLISWMNNVPSPGGSGPGRGPKVRQADDSPQS